MKKKFSVEVEVPGEEVVLMEESEKTESYNEIHSNFDSFSNEETNEDIERCIDTKRSKARGGVRVLLKKGKPKRVMIKKIVSTVREKKGRDFKL